MGHWIPVTWLTFGVDHALSRDNPRHVGALTQLGISLIALGRPVEALAPLEKAVSLDPTSGLAREALARARSAPAR